jgi:hypothetical protein
MSLIIGQTITQVSNVNSASSVILSPQEQAKITPNIIIDHEKGQIVITRPTSAVQNRPLTWDDYSKGTPTVDKFKALSPARVTWTIGLSIINKDQPAFHSTTNWAISSRLEFYNIDKTSKKVVFNQPNVGDSRFDAAIARNLLKIVNSTNFPGVPAATIQYTRDILKKLSYIPAEHF